MIPARGLRTGVMGVVWVWVSPPQSVTPVCDKNRGEEEKDGFCLCGFIQVNFGFAGANLLLAKVQAMAAA